MSDAKSKRVPSPTRSVTSQAGSSRPTVITNSGKELKVPLPEFFHGDKAKLKPFLMLLDLYIGFNIAKFSSNKEKGL